MNIFFEIKNESHDCKISSVSGGATCGKEEVSMEVMRVREND
jgi:hypothetical protein